MKDRVSYAYFKGILLQFAWLYMHIYIYEVHRGSVVTPMLFCFFGARGDCIWVGFRNKNVYDGTSFAAALLFQTGGRKMCADWTELHGPEAQWPKSPCEHNPGVSVSQEVLWPKLNPTEKAFHLLRRKHEAGRPMSIHLLETAAVAAE